MRIHTPCGRLAVVASIAILALADVGDAQTPATIDACYVPISGTIYRRNTSASPAPGAPATCLTPTHVAFQIQNGGATIGPDLIYSGRIDMGGSANFGSSLIARDAAINPALLPTGAGTRMMWIGQKAAFRAGAVNGGQWDFSRLGDGSVALGRNGTASGQDAVAIGGSTEALGSHAVAIGFLSGASGNRGIAIGHLSSATGTESMALGSRATPTHDGALVLSAAALEAIGSTAESQVTIRGSGGIRLVPANTAATNCTVSTAGTFACTGGVSLSNSIVRVAGPITAVGNASSQDARVRCPVGYRVSGGGVNTRNGDPKVRESFPENDQTWYARVRNDDPFEDGEMQVLAICVRE
jgi:hypothetical protein